MLARTISTKALLEDNPVRLDRLPDLDMAYGDHRFSLVRIGDEATVGFTRIWFWANGTKQLHKPEILAPYLKCGYGLGMYILANEIAHESGDRPVLQAQVNYLSESAERVWCSLVARGLAVGEKDYRNPYRFIS